MGGQIAQHVVGAPAPRLRQFIDHYIGYRYEGFERGVHAGLPSRHLTFIVSFGDPIDVGRLHDPAGTRERFAALVGGLHVAPAAVHHDGSQYGVQLAITPLGARALFGVPSAEIATLTLPLDAMLGDLAAELVERLCTAPTWSRRFAILDRMLSRELTELHDPPREVMFAWELLTRTGGAIEVGRLATEVGWSRRHMSERFRREFGLTPKTMARVIRFERARRMVSLAVHPRLGAVAAAAGYADQAHMNREWRELAGASPRAWLAAEQFPLVQVGADDEDAPPAS
jgi:AraC-like DNA-binding protein